MDGVVAGPCVDVSDGYGEFKVHAFLLAHRHGICVVDARACELALLSFVVALEVIVASCAVQAGRMALEPVGGGTVPSEPVASLERPSEQLEAVPVGLRRPYPWEIIVCADRPSVPERDFRTDVEGRHEKVAPYRIERSVQSVFRVFLNRGD